MYSYRVIPVVLLSGNRVVKTKCFKNPIYIGDPINILKIFNQKAVDELIILDIDASKLQGRPNFELLEKLASECFMPIGYGGGIRNIEDVRRLLSIGIEKLIFNSAFYFNESLIIKTINEIGSQSVVLSLDFKLDWLGRPILYSHAGYKTPNKDLISFANYAESIGVGELILHSVDRDGSMKGYDLSMLKELSKSLQIPIVACGGAGSIDDLRMAVKDGKASAVAAGSLFVFHGPLRGVLINYPSQNILKSIFE